MIIEDYQKLRAERAEGLLHHFRYLDSVGYKSTHEAVYRNAVAMGHFSAIYVGVVTRNNDLLDNIYYQSPSLINSRVKALNELGLDQRFVKKMDRGYSVFESEEIYQLSKKIGE